MNDLHNELAKKFPFLSLGKYNDSEYLGIIQNSSQKLVSMYLYDMIPSADLKKKFLYYGDLWWWESNREIPINLFINFMGYNFSVFKPYLKTFIAKEFELILGPITSLSNINKKRIKRRSIQLVKNLDDS